MSTFPRRGETHVLEDRGKRFFLDSIPSSWVIHEPRQGADYGTDFIVDVPSTDGLCRGASFRVQMKATTTMIADRGIVRGRLEVRHLRYLLVRPEPAMLVLYVDEPRSLYFAWLDDYRPHNGCGNKHPWWRCARPLPPDSSIKFEIDANDRVDAQEFGAKIQQSMYERQDIWFSHHVFWPTVDSLVDDENPRRFRNFNRAPDLAQYLEVSVIPRHLVPRFDAVVRAKAALSGAKEYASEHMPGIEWRPRVGEAHQARAQFRGDGFCCVAWTRLQEVASHIEISYLADALYQLYVLWKGAVGVGVEGYLEVAGLRVRSVPLHWLGLDYPLRRFYFFAGTPVSSDDSESRVKGDLGLTLARKLASYTDEPRPCRHVIRGLLT